MCLTTGAKHAKPSANHALGGTKVHTSVPKIEMNETKHERTYKSAGLPACLIGKCCSCFCFWFVLVPLFCCYAFLVLLNRVHPPSTPVLWTLNVYLADRLYTRPTKCCVCLIAKSLMACPSLHSQSTYAHFGSEVRIYKDVLFF